MAIDATPEHADEGAALALDGPKTLTAVARGGGCCAALRFDIPAAVATRPRVSGKG